MLWIFGMFGALALVLSVLRGEDRTDPGCVFGASRLDERVPVERTKLGHSPSGTIDLVARTGGEWNVYLDGRRVGVAIDDGRSSRAQAWVCPSLCRPSALERMELEKMKLHGTPRNRRVS